jgi:ZIP family zinc transporter
MNRGLTLALVPLALIGVLVAAFLIWRPLDYLSAGAPPREAIAFERVRLDGLGIHAYVRAEGSEPVTIAQVQVDDAYWSFAMSPEGALGRFATARIDIPYPWVAGEAHVVKLLTGTGTVFEHEIAVAAASPSGRQWLSLALVGLFVGPIPVLLGLAFHPALRRAGCSASCSSIPSRRGSKPPGRRSRAWPPGPCSGAAPRPRCWCCWR